MINEGSFVMLEMESNVQLVDSGLAMLVKSQSPPC